MSQTARFAAAILLALLGVPDEAGSEVYSSATDLVCCFVFYIITAVSRESWAKFRTEHQILA